MTTLNNSGAFSPPRPSPPFKLVALAVTCVVMEIILGLILFAGYTQTLSELFGSSLYLSELPFIGRVFYYTPNATPGHLICGLLALYSVGLPLTMFHLIERHKVFDDFRDWISHPAHQVLTAFFAILCAIVIALEVTTILSIMAPAQTSVFVPDAPATGLEAVAQDNPAMGLIAAMILIIINGCLAYFSAKTFHSLSSHQGG